ncbi:MAG TPA: V-type ATPase subunit [Candidatus Gallacutalibacter pullicola]|uniref:V-type ATPase subunit n=1 Tax=Candidatus Gallacutalibacter pullicola TaxID=2840830 RepID=A0A9D1DRS5_9FIRM|nr:V-type ATPase subunit [Candidatus Gallacutalibacter pullicola]
MLSTLSSNVVLSKARAMYGRRLTGKNYRELLACQSVPEIAHYLRANTDYAPILAGISESEIHRGELEARLKQKQFEDSSQLCRYELSVGEHFSEYLIERSEVEQILHCLMFLSAGTPEEYLFSLPEFLNKHTRINLYSLGHSKTFEDLLGAVSSTPYYKLLEPFRPVQGIPLDYTAVENALYTYLYTHLFDIINHYTRGETQKQLLHMFRSYIDLYNYVRIIRLKAFYHSGPDFIRSTLFPFGNIQGHHLDELLGAETKEEMLAALEKTHAGRYYLKIERSFPDQIPVRFQYLTGRRNIHFSTHPPVVMLSYIFLLQAEMQDLISIIEGIRYRIPTDRISKILTVLNFEEKG